jgi:hypothetical protein
MAVCKSVNKILFNKYVFSVFLMILISSFVFSATISSVSWGWTEGYLGVSDSVDITTNLDSCPMGLCYCNMYVNTIYAPSVGSDTGYITFRYTTSSGHTNRTLGELPFSAMCCDNEGMSEGCQTVTSSSK